VISNAVRVDVAVIGCGPAGIAAAARAAEGRAHVAVIDEGAAPGGQIWRAGVGAKTGGDAGSWKARLAASGARVMSSTSVVDIRRDATGSFFIAAERDGASVGVVARTLILATGARERFLPFPGWTLPNVIGVGGAQALLKSGMSFRGRRVVVAGSGPLLLPVAASIARAGADLALVAEQAPTGRVLWFASSLWRSPSMLIQAATLRAAFAGTRHVMGTWVVSAAGESSVESVTLTNGRSRRSVACDVLCVAFGLAPNTELARLLGCSVSRGAVVVDARQATSVPGVYCAGEPTGIGGVDLSLVEGEIAGTVAAGGTPSAALVADRDRLRRYAGRLEDSFALRDEVRRLAEPETIVCRCEDVRFRELDPSWSARQAKLYTRAGMGACQGRICGAALECVMGWSPDSVRPPIQPARLATMLADFETSDATQPRNP
jgi:thioredoxin reductase